MKMIIQKGSRTIAWETTRSLCSDPCYSAQGFSSSSCPFIFIITPESISVLTDHQPVNHQEEPQNSETPPDSVQDTIEISEIRQISDSVTEIQRAQNINSVSEEQCAQRHISVLNTTEIEVEIHAEESGAQHTVHFRDAKDQSECGSLTTQAPQSNLMSVTINALSTWISAVQPRESWYLAGWIKDSPIDFLVDPGAVVSAISLQCYKRLVDTGAIHTPLKRNADGTRGRKQIGYDSTWYVQFRTISTWISNSHRHSHGRSELSGHIRNGYFG